MACQPTSVEIRTYQVGFGDCFLLSFHYRPDDKRHVLIDFGTTELPARGARKTPAKPSEYMPQVAADIRQACGTAGLTAVIVTHRHADHISGFATDARSGNSGSIIRELRPKVVLQPWTEDPEAESDATHATRDSTRSRKSFIAGLAAMQGFASQVVEIAQQRPAWMSRALHKELLFLGMDNIANRSAIENLIEMGQAQGATTRWLRHGSSAGLERLLPGVKISVLGPPDLEQSEKIQNMRKRDPDQYWHLLANRGAAKSAKPPAHGKAGGASRGSRSLPMEARWFCERLQRVQNAELLQIVRSLDEQMNNTSVILLFEVVGKKLLFPGDAQIENWSYALEDAPDAAQTRARLADVDVYKVGHHGSLNATPRRLLWDGFRKRNSGQLYTLLSTLAGKHGNTRIDTEVPRRTLLSALKTESTLINTDDFPFGAAPKMCDILRLP